jgi:hypothetical protein
MHLRQVAPAVLVSCTPAAAAAAEGACVLVVCAQAAAAAEGTRLLLAWLLQLLLLLLGGPQTPLLMLLLQACGHTKMTLCNACGNQIQEEPFREPHCHDSQVPKHVWAYSTPRDPLLLLWTGWWRTQKGVSTYELPLTRNKWGCCLQGLHHHQPSAGTGPGETTRLLLHSRCSHTDADASCGL